MTGCDGIAPIRHNQAIIRRIFWKIRCTSRQGNSKYISRIDRCTTHSINSHQIVNRSRINSRNPGQCVHRLHHIRHINGGQRIICPVETSTGERNHKGLTHIEKRRIRYGIRLPKLVSRNKTRVNGVGDCGQCVGRAGLVACGDGFADAVDTRASNGDFEEELGREDVVFNVWVRDVDGVGGEKRNGVDLEKGCDLGDFKVGVEAVTHHGVAGVRVGAWFNC